MKTKYKFILASQSPRRKQLLEQIGMEFEICPARKEEVVTSSIPKEVCVELSKQKALEIASGIKAFNETHPDIASDQDIIIIGADTIVAVGNEILGKPKDEEDAKRMINMISDNIHSVYTGVTFVFMAKDGRVGEYSFFEKTDVEVYKIDANEIQDYIDSGDCMDKAGAYGIQGGFAKYIKGINGDYNNVVGLPVARVYQELKGILNGI